MDNLINEKLNQFVNDTAMNTAVRQLLESTILKPKGNKDVNYLASERIALDVISEAWRELDKFKINSDEPVNNNKQIGL